jgi:hypothetical protein
MNRETRLAETHWKMETRIYHFKRDFAGSLVITGEKV